MQRSHEYGGGGAQTPTAHVGAIFSGFSPPGVKDAAPPTAGESGVRTNSDLARSSRAAPVTASGVFELLGRIAAHLYSDTPICPLGQSYTVRM